MKEERSHDDLVNEFGSYYAASGSLAVRELEQRVFGIDYGGNGYTDVDDARRLAALLRLDSTSTLLDIGTGAGWPGLFLAKHSGCHVVLTDMPFDGLRVAHSRAIEERIDGQAVQANGSQLPFRKTSFDAVTHSDVLC